MAPLIATSHSGIHEKDILDEMCDFACAGVKHDFSVSESGKKYKFHFVISCIQSHVPAGVISEMEGDEMDYINHKWDLFD